MPKVNKPEPIQSNPVSKGFAKDWGDYYLERRLLTLIIFSTYLDQSIDLNNYPLLL